MLLENDKYINSKELLDFNIIHLYTKKPYRFDSKEPLEIQKDKLKELERFLNHKFDYIIRPNQTHSSNVRIITKDNINNPLEDTDAVITNLKNVALVTISADCQNIIIYDKEKEVIANIHSGWKGTLNQILSKTIELMIKEYGTNPKDLIAYISPCIQKCCFEVDEELANEFQNKFNYINNFISKGEIKDDKQKYFIDTVKINIEEMLKLGIQKNNIFTDNICTKCESNKYHSYRVDKEYAGRNCCLVALRK